MSESVIAVLLSGQLLLVIWEIVKGIAAHQARKKESMIKESDIHKMVFRLYKDNLKHRILDLFDKVDDPNQDIRADLMDLHDDVEVYFNNGGNGTVKQLYLHLAEKVRSVKGESGYALMHIDGLH